MKKTVLLLFALVAVHILSAQYCGTTSSSVPTGGPLAGGFEDPNTVPCAVQGVAYSHAIQFTMFSSFDFIGHQTVDSMEFLSIDNLPCGLCWSVDQADKRYLASEDGCLSITGTTTDFAGQYKFALSLKAWINGSPTPQTIPAQVVDQTGIRLFQRVKTSGGACANVDTSVIGNNLTASLVCPVLSYSVSLGADKGLCTGTVDTLRPVVSGGVSSYSYSWSSTGNSLSCNNCQNPIVTITQNSSYTVTVTDNAAATATATINYTVQAPVVPNISITPSTVTGCSNTAVTFTGSIVNGGSSPAYSWFVNDVNTGSGSASFSPIGLAYGDVVYCSLASSLTCVTQTTATSNSVTLAFSNHFNQQPSDATIQEGDAAHFSTSASNVNSSYQWQQNSGTGFVNLSNAGAYSGTDGNILTVSPVIAAYNNYTYRCIVSSPVGCSDTSDAAVLNVTVTGIQEMTNRTISIYPNPSKGNIYFNLSGQKVKTIDIYEVKGGFVKQIIPTVANGQMQVDISDLTSGMYFVVVKGDKTYRGKFVKE